MQSCAKYFTKPFPLSHGQTVKVYHLFLSFLLLLMKKWLPDTFTFTWWSSQILLPKWLNRISKSSCFKNSVFQNFLIMIHSKISFLLCNSGYITYLRYISFGTGSFESDTQCIWHLGILFCPLLLHCTPFHSIPFHSILSLKFLFKSVS